MSRLELFDHLRRLRDRVGDGADHGRAFDTILELANHIVVSAEVEAARAARLESLLAELRATERRKSEFLAMVAQDVQHAMTPVLDAADRLSTLELHARDLRVLVDNLVAVALTNFGPTKLCRSLVDLQEVLARAVEVTSPFIVERRLTVSCVGEREAVWLHADRRHLINAFTNLLAHAAKLAPFAGQLRIGVDVLATDVVVRVTRGRSGVPADVSDFLPAPWLAKEGSVRGKRGFGVAHFVARSLVELHGGAVEATTERTDLGATFVVRLPRARSDGASEARAEVSEQEKP